MDEFILFIKLGFWHVLDKSALDHVLFFIALTVVFTFTNWRKALWLITFFTLGHTLTFGLSVYGYLDVNADLIEFIIPITILIPLLFNIYVAVKDKKTAHNRNIYFAFFLGLIHGLGFSNYFKMALDVDDDKLFPLLEFALGIELSQVVVVLSMLALSHIVLYSFRIPKRKWIIIVSSLIILYIIPMLIERKFW
jgi:hypothetical protein